jgi:hypothetical protein
MKRVCAWCLRPLNNEPDGGTPVSHGICDRCLENTLTKIALLGSLRYARVSPPEADGRSDVGRRTSGAGFQ